MDPAASSELPQAQAPKNKKLFIGAIVFLGIVIVFIIITILTSGGGSREENVETSQDQEAVDNSSQQNPEGSGTSPAANPTAKENTFDNSFFSINYPGDWVAKDVSFPNGDTGISLRPTSSSAFNPTLAIVKSNAISPAAVQQKQLVYTSMGFGSNPVVVDKNPATQLVGSIPPKSATISASVSVIQTSHIYLNKGNSDYVFKYSYISRQTDPSLEETFEKMVASFRFN